MVARALYTNSNLVLMTGDLGSCTLKGELLTSVLTRSRYRLTDIALIEEV